MKAKIYKVIYVLIALFVTGGLTGVGVITYFSLGLPEINSLEDYRPILPSQILSSDGSVLAYLGEEKRDIAEVKEIPERIINSFLAAEDDQFFNHSGVDYMGVIRATWANIKAGKVVQGGSTITQQVAKSFLSRERSFSRKIKDFLLAQKIEKKLSKNDILYLYLNQVYLGGGYYGVKMAARGYFDKELSEMSIAESAMLAGLLVAPGKYSPYINPAYAKKRQSYVLSRMKATNKISEVEFQEATNEQIKYRLNKAHPYKAGYFTDWVRQTVIEALGEDRFLRDGLTINTTLDYELQRRAEKEVLEGAKVIDKRQGYKGVLGSLDLKASEEEYIKKYRENYYESESKYFTINDENEKVFELRLGETELEDLKFHNSSWEIRSRHLMPGYKEGDPLVSVLRVGENYEAVVVGVSSSAKIIYAKIGGVMGIIPERYFGWAKERLLSENREWRPDIRNPNDIVKVGDKVLVKLLDEKVSLWSNVENSFKKNKENKLYKDVANQKYLLLELDQEPEVQAALYAISPYSGEIKVMVGGSDFNKSQFNRILQSKRQPGSSFKPLIYACALENGYNPASILIDSPESLAGTEEGLNWKPRNYDGKYKGPMTFRNSLELSRNITTIKLADRIGVTTITDFLNRISFDAEVDPDLSLSLGSFGASLHDMVSSYAIFANGGKKLKTKAIVSVLNREGQEISLIKENIEKVELLDEKKLIESKKLEKPVEALGAESSKGTEKEEIKNIFIKGLKGDQVYDSRLSYIMTNLLKGVVQYGTGRAARGLGTNIGGKTGTTNNYVDAWFVGFSPKLVVGSWAGLDDNSTMGFGETGSRSALPIWKGFMEFAIKKLGEGDFIAPDGIVNVLINKETGRIAREDEIRAFRESFVQGYMPGSEVTNQDGQPIEDSGLVEDEYYDNL